MRSVTGRKAALAAICCATLVVLAGCDVFTSDSKRTQRAEQLLASGAYAESLIELRNVLDRNPNDARAQLLVAQVNLSLGNADGAESALNSATTAGATVAETDPLRAQVLLRRGANADLLAAIDSGKFTLDPKAKASLRLRALSGLNRCDDVLEAVRARSAADTDATLRRVGADCYLRRGNLARARQDLDAAVAEDPADAESWMARGQALLLSGKRHGAEESWNEAAKLAAGKLDIPQQAVLYTTLADLQSERGDLAAVKNSHDKLVRIAPQSPIAELLLARVQLMSGDTEPAANTLRKLLTTSADLVPAHRMLMAVYLAQGNLEQAEKELDWLEHAPNPASELKAVRHEYNAVFAAAANSEERWVRTGLIQRGLGESAAARDSFMRALKVQPDSKRARLALVNLELRVGNTAAAAQRADELAADFPDDTQVLMAAAEARAADRQFAPALAALERAAAKAPSAQLAVAQHQMRRRAKHADPNEPLRAWLAGHGGDLAMRAMLAESLRVSGDNAGAIAEYEKLNALRSNSPVVLNNLAWVYHLAGDPRALDTARRAFQLAPKSPSVQDTYGWLLVQSGAAKDGLEPLSQADAQIGAAQPSVRFHYAAALARTGQADRARVMLAALLADYPDFDERAAAAKLRADLE